MVGGFAGFVWGWFQVPDYAGGEGWEHLAEAYGWPLGGLMATLVLFVLVRRVTGSNHLTLLVRVFAGAAIACYYWYRLPALFGFGPFPGDGMLIDLRETLPAWGPALSRTLTTAFFAWWLVGRRTSSRTWSVRPPIAEDLLPTSYRGRTPRPPLLRSGAPTQPPGIVGGCRGRSG
jgi:hypothetical protein